MFQRLHKIHIFLILNFCLASCLPYYFQGLGGSSVYNQRCEENPYTYNDFPKEWLIWEKIHWDTSCFQKQSNVSVPYPYTFNGGYIDQRTIRNEQNFTESNPFMRFY